MSTCRAAKRLSDALCHPRDGHVRGDAQATRAALTEPSPPPRADRHEATQKMIGVVLPTCLLLTDARLVLAMCLPHVADLHRWGAMTPRQLAEQPRLESELVEIHKT